MIQVRKFYDMLGDGTTGAYKDVDGDWIEYKKPALSSPSPLQEVEEKWKRLNREFDAALDTYNPIPKVEGVEEAAEHWANTDQKYFSQADHNKMIEASFKAGAKYASQLQSQSKGVEQWLKRFCDWSDPSPAKTAKLNESLVRFIEYYNLESPSKPTNQ